MTAPPSLWIVVDPGSIRVSEGTWQLETVKIVEKHDLFSRWTHWVNFPLLTLMIWSGILIYWANTAYLPLPDSVAEFLHIDRRLAMGMQWHFFLVWPFVINGLVFFAAFLFKKRWREYAIDRHTFPNAVRYALWDLGLSKTPPPSESNAFYNPAQKLTYLTVFVLSVGAVLSGFAIYKPVQLKPLTELLGGYEAARLEHFICMIALLLFFAVHLIQVIRGGWNHFRAMIAGYEEVNHDDQR